MISIIFNIDKYKAYQNVSLQLFDQESVIYEEEGIATDSRHQLPNSTHERVTTMPTIIKGASAHHSQAGADDLDID